MRRDPYSPYPPDCDDADEVRRGMTSQRRYVADDTDADPITQPSRPIQQRRASQPGQQTGVPQRRRGANTTAFYSAETEHLSFDRQPSTRIRTTSSRRPVAPPRSTGTTPRSIPAETRPVQPQLSRRKALGLFGGVFLIVSGMGYFKGRSYLQNQVFDQYNEGKQRSKSIAIVCGHNHDSPQHPTLLHAYLADNYLIVDELPAGDPSKAHVTKSIDLRTMGYQGDPKLAVISIDAPTNANGKIPQIIITLEGGVVNVWGQRQDVAHLILTDDGTAYRAAPQGKK